jgi:hypothetical protein
MKIYFEDLKQDIQTELIAELMTRLAEEERNYEEKAGDFGLEPQEYLSEKADHIINTRNWGVEMDF